jgi:protein disulfide isomerase
MNCFTLFGVFLLALKVYASNTEVLTENFLDLFESESKSEPNPNGQIVHLTSDDFEKKTADDMWFIMFHAPWCGHCKQLAPTWNSVAYHLKGQVNVGKVDCTANGRICQQMNVQGYPTLKIVQGKESTEYRGSRQIDEILNFAISYTSTALTAVEKDDMDKFISNNENNYLYYYDASNPNLKDLKLYLNAARAHSNSGAKFLVTSDTQMLEIMGDETDTSQSKLVLLQDHNTKKIPYTKRLSNESELNKWIAQTKYPLFTEISSQNSEEIMDNHDLVVIGFINGNTVNSWTPKFKEAARKWRASELADNHNVVFTWIDGSKWSKYISKVYHLEPTDLPRIIFTKPDTEQFYDLSKNGKLIHEDDINEALESVYDGSIEPKYIDKAVTRVLKKLNKKLNAFGDMISDHPIISALVIIVSFVGFILFSIYVIPSDYESINKVDSKMQ